MKSRGNITFFISSRFARYVAGRRSRIATWVAVAGIALSVFTMIVTISVVTGFQQELKNKIGGFTASISIFKDNEKLMTPDEVERLEMLIATVAPEARIYESYYTPALLKSNDNFDNLLLQWHTDPVKLDFYRQYIVEGTVPEASDSIAGITLSSATAAKLNVGLGDRLDVVFPVNNGYKQRRIEIAGIFDTHFTDFDSNIALASPELLESIYRIADKSSKKISVDLPHNTFEDVAATVVGLKERIRRAQLTGEIDSSYYISDIHHEAAGYFGWLAILDTNVVVIIILMGFIAAFTLITSIVIIIMERIPAIAILRTMGSTNAAVKSIFMIMGARLLATALIIANVAAALLIFLQNHYGFMVLNPENYYLTSVPMNINLWTFFWVDVASVCIGITVLLLPAMIVNRLSITKALNFQ